MPRSAGPGRPPRRSRGTLDAVFRLAARTAAPGRAPAPWRTLPPRFGKADTAARRFRRWARAGLWTCLLQALADPDRPGVAALRRLESWICRTYRRARRLLGIQGVAVLARRLGSPSALRASSVFLPDPHLSEVAKSRFRPVHRRLRERGFRAALAMVPHPDFLRAADKLLWAACGGTGSPGAWPCLDRPAPVPLTGAAR